MLSSGRFALRPYRTAQGRGLRKIDPASSLMIFADVAIDTTTRELSSRLFTYEVPAHLREEVFVGSQVLVPFGQQELVCGYVISLRDSLSTSATEQRPDFRTKAIVEILESQPLFDRAYVGFLHWVAEYYSASILEVINAAVPSDVGTRVKRVVRLKHSSLPETSTSAETVQPVQLTTFPQAATVSAPASPSSRLTEEQSLLIELLLSAKDQALSLKALKQRSSLTQSRFYGALSRLRQESRVVVERESDVKANPKVVQTVIWTGADAQTKKQEEILSALKRAGGQMTLSALAEAAASTPATIKKMVEKGLLSLVTDEVLRDPLAALKREVRAPMPELTEQQKRVLEVLKVALDSQMEPPEPDAGQSEQAAVPEVQPWLLHGVTGSGKTEIYLRLIDMALQKRRSVLMLVPEISLTPQLAQRLVQRFGDLVAVWHSALSAGERFDTWRRLKSGQARVLLGARSAVLANLPDLGLIILDEEHDGSYKQSSPSPRYHAKTVALERARRTGSMVLLGSATPDVATYFECHRNNKIVELPERVFKQSLPHAITVDMRLEFSIGNRSVFSRALQEAMAQCLGRGEQAILLINRRGYASHVFCRACGFVMKCRNCSVSLVYHQEPSGLQHSTAEGSSLRLAGISADAGGKRPGSPLSMRRNHPPPAQGYLVCHHCAYTTATADTCPACHSPFIRQFGLGTQRVEEEVQSLFPKAKMLRLDSDITSKRGAYEEIFKKFSAGEADILIGTQIVAKGLDIPRVTLVGVMAADASFNLPDYRSAERGFQLLTQVSGRAGRGHDPGKVFLQTFNMDLPALALAKKQDYQAFYEQELSGRQGFEYPPFSQLIRVVIAGDRLAEVEWACEQLAEELSNHVEDRFDIDSIKILGPAPCLIERLRGKYRQHLLIKNLAGEPGRLAITQFLRLRRGYADLTMAVDVDAVDLL